MEPRLKQMEAKEVYLRLEKQFPGQVGNFKGEVPEPYCMVSPEGIVEICRFLRDDSGCKFEVLSDLTALDWPKEEKIQVVYHLYSYSNKAQIVLKIDLPRDKPAVPTLEGVWKVANWFEREAFDLYGVVFNGHPDLRRILTDYGFVGHPFRKDFPVSGTVEMRYDPDQQRVIYQPVTIEPREITPRIVRVENYGDVEEKP